MDNNKESNASFEKEADENTHGVSKIKRNASQFYAAFAAELVKIVIGLYSGFTSVLIAELHKPDAEIEMSVEELGWFSSRYFIMPFGFLLAGLIAHKIGNRSTMLLATFTCTISSLMFYFATDSTMLSVAHTFNGFALPLTSGPCFVYIVEITQPHLRSGLTAATTLVSLIAGFLIVLLSNFFHWRILVLVILVFPIVGFFAVWTIPESPHWLARNGKFDKAIVSLSWVRGWTTPNNVAPEFEKIKESYKQTSPDAEHPQKIRWYSKIWSYIANVIKAFSQRLFYIPLASMSLMYIIRDFSGAPMLGSFFIIIFREMGSPIDPNVAGSIFDAAHVLGAVVYIVLVNRTGKNKLAYITLVVSAISYFVISAALFAVKYGFAVDACLWLATVTMIVSTFATSAGIEKVLAILNFEIFPAQFRNIGCAISFFVAGMFGSVSNKLFLHILDILTMPGIFVMFGIASIVNVFMFYLMFPETEGKTLKEIEEHYSGVKKIKS